MIGHVVEAFSVELVRDADLHGVEHVEHVELGDRNFAQRVEPHGLTKHHGIEPTRTTSATGVGAKLVSTLDQEIAHLVGQLGRKRTGPHPGAVRLGDPDHPIDVQRTDPRAGARTASDWVRRGHERIRAVIEVEEGRLSTLQQHVLSGLE